MCGESMDGLVAVGPQCFGGSGVPGVGEFVERVAQFGGGSEDCMAWYGVESVGEVEVGDCVLGIGVKVEFDVFV